MWPLTTIRKLLATLVVTSASVCAAVAAAGEGLLWPVSEGMGAATRVALEADPYVVRWRLVDRIPPSACARCRDLTFGAETVEQVRLLEHGEAAAAKSAPFGAFEVGNASKTAARSPVH